MLINLKVKTLDARTHDFSIDNEITIREFKAKIAEKTNISAESQRLIYQGRVLNDEKQVKEYDVDGKVLHVAERPPFSQRDQNSRSNDEPRPVRTIARPGPGNMRNSPLFRAFDGMLVGTMAIPVNNGQVAAARAPPNRFPTSSSFCINRITVALHMIDCANNIAAYLENPEVGLNNQSLDILQRGRWTVESTVVEVGVTASEMPRNNTIMDMVQDAVSAALSRNTNGRNYTVLQLPTVYANADVNPANDPNNTEVITDDTGGTSSDSSEETAAAAVLIEDVLETDEEAPFGDAPILVDSRAASAAADSTGSGRIGIETTGTTVDAGNLATGAVDDADAENPSSIYVSGIGSRRRTRPQVLANVIERYRNVQTRLSPFIDRYYSILNEDPAYDENSIEERDNAQRIFDRVSEAFHYLSHAQHAISDLMLDLSQAGPRVLTCRPILVEQSGYIRSNSVLTPFSDLISQGPPPGNRATQPGGQPTSGQAAALQTALGQAATVPPASPQGTLGGPQRFLSNIVTSPAQMAVPILRSSVTTPRPQAAAPTDSDANRDRQNADAAASTANHANETIEDPIDDPMTMTMGIPNIDAHPMDRGALDGREQRIGVVPRLRLYMPVSLPPSNPHTQVTRIIQAVVDSANADGSDVHLEFNTPAIASMNMPMHMVAMPRPNIENGIANTNTNAESSNESGSDRGSGGLTTDGSNSAASTSSGTRGSGEQRTGPLPTTSTQTHTPPRPQIHMGGHNNWGGRLGPTHTAFDRFLPCNSHHIRDPETGQPNNNNNTPASVTLTNTSAANRPGRTATQSGNSNVNENLNSVQMGTERATQAGMGTAGGGNRADASSSAISIRAVIADRLPGQSGGMRPLPTRRRSMVNRDSSMGQVARFAANRLATAAASMRARRQSLMNPRQSSAGLNRQIPTTLLANYIGTNLRNNAQTASAGSNSIVEALAARGVSPAATATGLVVSSSTILPIVAAPVATITAAAAAAAASAATSTQTPAPQPQNAGPMQHTPISVEANNLRTQLRSFLRQTVFEGAPMNDETTPSAISRALEWFSESLIYLPQYERPQYNSRDSVRNILRLTLGRIIDLCNTPGMESGLQFEQSLKQICDQFRTRLYSVLFVCAGRSNAELFWRQLMRLLCVPLRSNFGNEALQFLCIYIDPTIPASTDITDAQQFLVLRCAGSDSTSGAAANAVLDPHKHTQNQTQHEQSELDSDIEMADVASSSEMPVNKDSETGPKSEPEPPLPIVTVGTEPWHATLPNEWLPVITRDLQNQTEQNTQQPPFSDAYISGMSAKRRKVIQTDKPSSDVESLISQGVQRAMQNTGVTSPNSANSSEAIKEAIAQDPSVQSSYTEAVRINARERMKKDADFKANKYPQLTKFSEQK